MKDWLDTILGRVTMYRLVTLSLLALFVAAFLLSIVHYLSYSPASLLVTFSLLVGVSYASNRLLGMLFGVRPHGESAIITGLILAFILAPVSSVAGLLSVSLIVAIANASKYILIFRGRHIFNPVAVGALFATFSGLSYSIWWVASPALLPLTVVVSFLILYKTHHLKLGVLFIAVTMILIASQNVMAGEHITGAVKTVFTSWPILFFAGVMLSEPLTLPPRRWQQLTVVMIVALLFVTPLHSTSVSMTPQLALLLGNAVAFIWGTRQAIRLKFVNRIKLTDSSYEFVFKSIGPAPYYIAGQYMELTLPHDKADSRGQRRMFTVSSNPQDTTIRFGVKIPKRHSSFKRSLFNLSAGNYVTATKVSGDFVLPSNQMSPLLWVAGGIGVTPFVSYARQLIYDNQRRDITLVYSVKSMSEIAYLDILRQAHIKIIVIAPDAVEQHSDVHYINAPFITLDILHTAVTDITRRQVYISGSPVTVNHMKNAVIKLGAVSIQTDYFTGY